MCGIIGKVGEENAVPSIINGLQKLEYRGYDSAGIAFSSGDGFTCIKTVGRVAELKKLTECNACSGNVGIGHTRWATHGAPTRNNAHPHVSPNGMFAVVHNGIIENAEALKKQYTPESVYVSQTDTEVVAHLLQKFFCGDIIKAVSDVCRLLKGSYALGILCNAAPNTVFAVAFHSPLFAVKGSSGCYIASDIGAVEDANEIYRIENGELCSITGHNIEFFDRLGVAEKKECVHLPEDKTIPDKCGYEHYMLKEIMQQPKAVGDTLAVLLRDGCISGDVFPDRDFIKNGLNSIDIVACGSAYHAGLAVCGIVEKYCRVPCRAYTASEYRYADGLADSRTLTVLISQSGETADTLAAADIALAKGVQLLNIVNVPASSMTLNGGKTVLTKAGREIAVATTKAYSAQLVVLYALAVYIARVKGFVTETKECELVAELLTLPEKTERVLTETEEDIKSLAKEISSADGMFFIGRLADHAAAVEGALKMKEISYINSQGYAAGELKHGTISLIKKGTPVVAVATQSSVFAKTCSNLSEVKARGAFTVLITSEKFRKCAPFADRVIFLPDTHEAFACSLSVIPMQLLSYYTAKERGCDIDKPKNLAKSVTVE